MAQPYGKPAIAVVPLEEAIRVALEKAAPDGLILVTGSLFVVAAAKQNWELITKRNR